MARKVLLADDSVTAQNMGRRILVDAGYEVITVNNGASALKKVAESKPDLIVLDVYMPGYGGLEVCQRIRESQETARIPVLLTVGKLEPFKSDDARRVRADAFIVKPFEASELLTALTKLEDKIVPQPSGRKAGRSARNFADEEPGASREFGDVESGWKNRLKIPPPHHPRAHDTSAGASADLADARPSEPPQAVSESSPVAKAEERVEIAPAKEQQPGAAQEISEFPIRADESVAEFASAASEEIKHDKAETEARTDQEPTQPEAVAEVMPSAPESAGAPAQNSHEDEVAAALASLAPSNGHGSDTTAEPQPLPVTMAAAAETPEFSGPRWIAEAVALSDDEASLILEQEMHKAIAALAAADAARMPLSSSLQESSGAEAASSQPGEVPVSSASPELRPEEPVSFATASNPQESAQAPQPVTEAVAAPQPPQSDSSAEEPREAAAYAAAASAGASLASAASTEAESVAPSSVAADVPAAAESTDSDLAAAWASWKQVRDSVSNPEPTAQIADTIASGFKEIRHEEPSSTPEPEAAAPADENVAIASIVDSVLAELKPKLMQEIAKKIKK